MILVTGSEGLIGRSLVAHLQAAGTNVRRFDIRRTNAEDIRHRLAVESALKGVSGVVHLAAISRVMWAQSEPFRCWETNVNALANILDACLGCSPRPWFLFASSREVYGEPTTLPVPESARQTPMNVYARSKYVGEGLTVSAADAGLRAHVCRFSNVYGAATDHGDRVAMAFARAAVGGGRMVVEGAGNIFDFTTIDDVVEGLSRLIGMIQAGENVPAVHFVSGVGTSLLELANIAAAHARVPTTIHETSGRTFDVTRFVGDPRRAEELLGWRAETLPMSGMAQLVSRLETFRG